MNALNFILFMTMAIGAWLLLRWLSRYGEIWRVRPRDTQKPADGSQSKSSWIPSAILLLISAAIIAGFSFPSYRTPGTSGRYLESVSHARQVHMGVDGLSLEYANNENKEEYKGACPADLGIKSGLEYVRYLVKSGAFKESELKLFCKRERHVAKLDDLRADDLAFRFANVSFSDPSGTIFMVSRNYVEGGDFYVPPPWKRWISFFYKDPLLKGFVVFRVGGDGSFYNHMPQDPALVGKLPPREPAFLEP